MNKTNATLFGEKLDDFLEQVKKDKEAMLSEMDDLYEKIFSLEKKQIHYQNTLKVVQKLVLDIFSMTFPDQKLSNPVADLEKIKKWIKEKYNDKL